MIVIVEGNDNCGKSTLIKDIRKYILKSPRTTSIHCASPPDGYHSGWSEEHYSEVLGMSRRLCQEGWDIILDRSHLGEDVYGPVFRQQSADYIYDIEKQFLSDIDSRLILLTDSPEGIIEREDGYTYSIKPEMIERVSQRFLEVYNNSSVPHKLHYHITNDGGFENLLPTVKEFLNE